MSKIEWTDKTWNPIVGCSYESAGCKNCYAERMAFRLSQMGNETYQSVCTFENGWRKWNGKTHFVESVLEKPLHWKTPRNIFICSMSDLFHPSVPFEWIYKIFAVMALCPQHTFQVLTKRPDRMAECLYDYIQCVDYMQRAAKEMKLPHNDFVYMPQKTGVYNFTIPLPNVWLGTTVEHPDYKYRIDELRKIPAALRFLSFEPLLADPGEVDLGGIGWVICGGESGPGARPMHPDWARGLRDQCKAADVDFFFKQWGAYAPLSKWRVMVPEGNYAFTPAGQKITPKDDDPKHHVWPATENDGYKNDDEFSSYRVGKKKAGCLLDGALYKEFPKDSTE